MRKETWQILAVVLGFVFLFWFVFSCQTRWENDGYARGYEKAREELYEEFYKEGFDAGRDEGYTAGYNDGFADGEKPAIVEQEDRQQ